MSGERQIAREQVIRLLDQGLSIFPIEQGSKRPLVLWSAYQQRLPDQALVKAWLKAWPSCSWAVACGPASRLTVIDVDPRHGGDMTMAQYPPLPPTVVTGSGGWHTYLRVPDAIPSKNGWMPGVDLKSRGSYVIVPPSIHESGNPYRWVGSALDAIPEWVRPLLPAAHEGATAPPSAHSLPFSTQEAPAFLSRLHGVHKTSGGWLACCPVHADREPSLCVRVLPDGRLWVKCFAGCPYGAVREMLDFLSLASTCTPRRSI